MSSPATAARLLLVSDASSGAADLGDLLAEQGHEVVVVSDPEDGLARLTEERWSLVLGSLNSDVDLLAEALLLPDTPEVILFDEFGTLEDAVRAVRLGAFDCIALPASEEQVVLSVERALAKRRLAEENRRLREDVGERFTLAEVESRDPRMRALFHVLESVADTSATVLLEGESGTGKSLLAHALHQRSGRARGPFVDVNCGALPGGLLESELFGHVRGAFTGAERDRLGKFEAAAGGTLFLDEIATASPELQVKLLRVLQEGRFERVGEAVTREADVRLVAATNRRLEEEVAAGRFREDLYYRIRVVSVEVPPLRERSLDVPFLAERFLARYAAQHGRDVRSIAPEALARMGRHGWPGNVRELQHAVERAVLLAGGPELLPEDFPDLEPRAGVGPGGLGVDDLPLGPLKTALEVPERRLIERALEACGGRRKDAAALLAINRTTLFNKMRKYGLLDRPAPR